MKTLTVRLPDSLAAEIEAESRRRSVSKSDIVRERLERAPAGAAEPNPASYDIADLIGSVDGLRVPAMESYPYSASKAGVHMVTRHLARRLGSEHITVNAIAPGPFRSKMTAFMLDEHAAEVAAGLPLGRIGEPDDVAGAAIYLSSRAGAYVTGAVIPVDGGYAA